MSSIQCGGFCCERFSTQYSPREWKRWAQAIRNGDNTWKLDNGEVHTISKDSNDVLKIADMVMLKETRKKYKNLNDPETHLKYRYLYTCKHFNAITRLCGNYENRPEMCSGYPENTGRPCNIKECLCK